MKTVDYIAALKAVAKKPSVYAVAQMLEMNETTIRAYALGDRYPDEFACMRIAETLNLPIEKVLADIALERETDPKRREKWRLLLKKFEATVMVVSGIAVALIGSLGTETADASPGKIAFDKCVITARSIEQGNINYTRWKWLFGCFVERLKCVIAGSVMHPI